MNKKILNLAIPNILSNLTIPLLSSVDTAVVGHLAEVYYLGAIAIGGMIFNAIYWAFGFLRMGTTGLTAQAHGKEDKEEVTASLGRALSVAVIVSVVLIALQGVISYVAFYLVEASPEVEQYAKSYFDIRIYAAPATLSLYVFHGWFIGMQNAKYPLYLSIVVNVLNIGFNLMFIYQFGMNSDGVALGTLCAQYLGLATAIFLMFRKYREYIKVFKLKMLKNIEALTSFFKVNFDIFIRTLSLMFVISYFTAKSAAYGDDVVAVNTILLQLWMIISYGIDGFAFAAESLVGNYYGAGDLSNLRRVVKNCFYWAFGLSIIISLLYLFYDREIISIFTDKEFIIDAALIYFVWVIAAPVLNSICFIWDGVFVGAMATTAMRNSMLVSSFLVYFPVFYFSESSFGNHSLWLALTAFMIARGGMMSLYYKKDITKRLASN
ncbi:MAG: MATE family efflux transporter [Rhodothermaceae bacterium]